uniref:Uncharacterized protein n=1 Tax=Hanusia phi TaxID=3032 RepID=A0A7S0NCC4_9CRYP|mmetsp:Transcript_6099/g.14082  ORF Transcript_6099/g.14082 Transcript_6099/m.14082 type:complete len:210 (+) Transcript_6099:412-1041(+)
MAGCNDDKDKAIRDMQIKLAVALEKNKALESENEHLKMMLTMANPVNDYGNEDELRKIRKALKAARGELESLRALHDTFLESKLHMNELDIIKYMAEYKSILLQSEMSSPSQSSCESVNDWIGNNQIKAEFRSSSTPLYVGSKRDHQNSDMKSVPRHNNIAGNTRHFNQKPLTVKEISKIVEAKQSVIRQKEVELRKRTSANGCVEFDF